MCFLFTMSDIDGRSGPPQRSNAKGVRTKLVILSELSDLTPGRLWVSNMTRSHRSDRRLPIPAGGARRDRTDDLMLAKHALSQLSYGPGTVTSDQKPPF